MAVSSFSLFTSCGSDSDDCSDLSEWIGAYTIVGDTICSADPDIFIANEVELEPSSVSETFEYEGEPFVITDCTATDGFFTFTKDGDKLTVELNSTGCIWEFNK